MEKGQENMIDVDQNSKKDIFAVQCSFGKNIWQFQKAEHYLKWSNGGPKGRPNVVRIITIRNTVAAANSRRPSVLLVKDHMLMRVLLWLMLQHDNGKENNASLNALQAIIQDYLQDSKGFQSLDLRQDTKKHEKQRKYRHALCKLDCQESSHMSTLLCFKVIWSFLHFPHHLLQAKNFVRKSNRKWNMRRMSSPREIWREDHLSAKGHERLESRHHLLKNIFKLW